MGFDVVGLATVLVADEACSVIGLVDGQFLVCLSVYLYLIIMLGFEVV